MRKYIYGFLAIVSIIVATQSAMARPYIYDYEEELPEQSCIVISF